MLLIPTLIFSLSFHPYEPDDTINSGHPDRSVYLGRPSRRNDLVYYESYPSPYFNQLLARLASVTLFIRAIRSLDDVVIIGDEEGQWDTVQGLLPGSMLQKWVTTFGGSYMTLLLEVANIWVGEVRERPRADTSKSP